MNKNQLLDNLGITAMDVSGATGGHFFDPQPEKIETFTPIDGSYLSTLSETSAEDYDEIVQKSQEAFLLWRQVPAPQRGDMVRVFGNKLRHHKDALGRLVSLEMGKSLQEGLGEVQEMIDICDFAVGLSRQLYGLTMHSERPNHRMYEQYHPLGPVGIISAFNFPVAVWAWNAMIAWVCGDTVIWKPSEKVPLCALAVQKIGAEVIHETGSPEGIMNLVFGGRALGNKMAKDDRIPLISATGSIPMGKSVAETVGKRLGKTLLELGGNNAVIITPTADLKLVIPGVVFGAIGTCGQRCTSTRRLIIHESIYDTVCEKLQHAYHQLKIGSPLDENSHVGPLIDQSAVDAYLHAIQILNENGAKPLVEGGILDREGYYVKPCIYEADPTWEIVQHETFAPILYVTKYKEIEEAIAIQNGVVQGLSSAIMTQNIRESELFLSASGSDCGIANVNIGTSGAEIGGAFGGEKETGGGRESGSDAWKAYMRRQTNTINYGTELPLAQGIRFEL